MALTSTTLSAAISASQTQFGVTSTAAGFPPIGTNNASQPLMIDAELMFITGVPASGVIVVRGRGSDGSIAVSHDVLSNVYTSPNPGDFPPINPTQFVTVDITQETPITVGQDGAIPVFAYDSIVNINKATAAALTLAAPLIGTNGVSYVITSNTALAHVITATGLFQDGSAGAPHTTATFLAQRGASMHLVSENGFWNVVASNGVTFS